MLATVVNIELINTYELTTQVKSNPNKPSRTNTIPIRQGGK